MSMKKFYYLIGYPASGKTTLAKAMKSKYYCDYVSTDEIIDSMFKAGAKYSEILDGVDKYALREIINKGITGKNIVFDTYKPYAYERKPLLDALPETYEKVAVIMDTPLEECIKRFNKRAGIKAKIKPYFAEETIEMPSLTEFDRVIRSSDIGLS